MQKIEVTKNKRSLEFETKNRRSVIYKFRDGFRADRSHFYSDGGWKTTGNLIYNSPVKAIRTEWAWMSSLEDVPGEWIILLKED